jgi:hypothetical protein
VTKKKATPKKAPEKRVVKPREQQTSLQVMRNFQWYRGFRIYDCKYDGDNRGRTVIFCYKVVNLFLPRSFTWKSDSDVDLYSYINALMDRRELDAKKFEDAGFATDIVYNDYPKERPLVQVSPHLLLALLRGELPFECTADTMLVMRCDKSGKYSAERFIADLASSDVEEAYFYAIRQFVEGGKPILLTEALGEVSKVPPRVDVKPCINLHYAEQRGKGIVFDPALAKNMQMPQPGGSTQTKVEEVAIQEAVAQAQMPTEEILTTREVGMGTEVISMVLGEQPYFVRRTFGPSGHCLGTATSWKVGGPWVEAG